LRSSTRLRTRQPVFPTPFSRLFVLSSPAAASHPAAGEICGLAAQPPALNCDVDTSYFSIAVPLRYDFGSHRVELDPAPSYQAFGPSAGDEGQAAPVHVWEPATIRLFAQPSADAASSRLTLRRGAIIAPIAARLPIALTPEPGQAGVDRLTYEPGQLWLEIRTGGTIGWIHGEDAFRAVGLPAVANPPVRPPLAPAMSGCYAYTRAIFMRTSPLTSRLWVACAGQAEPVTLMPLANFAIDPGGRALAIQPQPWYGSDTALTQVISLEAVPKPLWSGQARVIAATCGTLVWERADNAQQPGSFAAMAPFDLLAQQDLASPSTNLIYCDSRGRIFASWQAGRQEMTLRGSGMANGLSTSASEAPSVSPNGRFVVWIKSYLASASVCLLGSGSAPSCAPLPGGFSSVQGLGRSPSVNDSGVVLFEGRSGPHKASPHIYATYEWRAGMPNPVLVRYGAANPQWISTTTAARLRRWYQMQTLASPWGSQH